MLAGAAGAAGNQYALEGQARARALGRLRYDSESSSMRAGTVMALSFVQRQRRFIRHMFDPANASTSTLSMLVQNLTLVLILVSSVETLVESLPEFQGHNVDVFDTSTWCVSFCSKRMRAIYP